MTKMLEKNKQQRAHGSLQRMTKVMWRKKKQREKQLTLKSDSRAGQRTDDTKALGWITGKG